MKEIFLIGFTLFLLTGCGGRYFLDSGQSGYGARNVNTREVVPGQTRVRTVSTGQPVIRSANWLAGKKVTVTLSRHNDWRNDEEAIYQAIIERELLRWGVDLVETDADYTLNINSSDMRSRKIVSLKLVDSGGKVVATSVGEGRDSSYTFRRSSFTDRREWEYLAFERATINAVRGLF
ncbi:hypothetical protein KKD04_03065 [Patescibacteria group bacterium]|nr:hypothetical protein [Patescibacteria group bacterium]